MAGRETDDNNSMEYSGEEGNHVDEGGGKGWKEVVRRRESRDESRFKRKKNTVSVSEAESEGGESEGNNSRAGMPNVVVRFEEEGGVKN